MTEEQLLALQRVTGFPTTVVQLALGAEDLERIDRRLVGYEMVFVLSDLGYTQHLCKKYR